MLVDTVITIIAILAFIIIIIDIELSGDWNKWL